MPDIGLLQGGPPRPRGPAPAAEGDATTPVARAQVTQVAAHFVAPGSISIALPVVSAAMPDSAAGAAATPARRDEMPAHALPGSVPPPIRARDLLWLGFALLLIVGTGIGIRDPWPADEPRFAAIARDMVATGEWLFPRVGGDLYQDKPPFFFWLLALCYTLLGSLKLSFVLPSFFAAGGVLFLIYDFGRRVASREAGVGAALLTLCSLQFTVAMRGAQIDPTLCFLTTLSLYALLRHLLLGPAWRWYVIGGLAAGVGVITKGVGFLPLLSLIPYFALRRAGWGGLATLDAGRGGWRWWLAPLAMLCAISLWLVPMLVAVDMGGAPEYAAYRDEILFKQTVGRYAASWHHVKAWYYFVLEVVPLLWLPWSLLLIWLVPRFKAAVRLRDARVWLPLGWGLLVLLFFSLSPGKRGIYVLPAMPALACAALPFLDELFARQSVRRAGLIMSAAFFLAAAVLTIGYAAQVKFALEVIAAANLRSALPLYVFLVLGGAGLAFAYARAPLFAWPATLASLALVFSYFIVPAMNAERSGSGFVRVALAQVKPEEELALVAYKEQFLLYLDRPTVNFGHRRWLEGPQESYDASAWLDAAPNRVLLVPADQLQPCFSANPMRAGMSTGEEWFLIHAPAAQSCAAKGDARRAIRYLAKAR